jgi:PAS domain S-box-containing protein
MRKSSKKSLHASAKEAALRASELCLQRLLETDAVGILFFEAATGTLVDANDVFLGISGYTREQVHSRQLTWRTMTPPEWIDVSEKQMKRFVATGRVGPYEKEYFCADASRRWMLFTGRDLGDGTIAEYCIDLTDRKLAKEALARISRKLIESQEQERTRIGRELHDDINQRLAMLAIGLEQLQNNPLDVLSRLQELREETSAISSDVHALSHELHSSKLEYYGRNEHIEWCCVDRLNRQGLPPKYVLASTIPIC